MLLMLEDDAERIVKFRATLQLVDPLIPLQIWNDAWSMIREIQPFLTSARLISLDHDLEPTSDADPGTGWDVVKYLVTQHPVCPVIVHTSNSDRASWMLGELELEGWEYHRLPPLGDDWIEHDWYHLVRRLLRRKRPSK
jgi:hypothetical protein